MTKSASVIIGVDVGGTKILLENFDADLKQISSVKVRTETKKGEKGFLNQLYALIDEFFHPGIRGIGVALPGIVDHKKGILGRAPHLPHRDNLPLRKLLEKRYQVKVRLDNDINAFLWAEKDRSNLKKYQNIVAVMVGTGTGGAILNDGRLVYGKNGYAGEVGHMIVNQSAPLKSFEQNTSGLHIPKIAKMLGIKQKMTSYDLADNTAASKKVRTYILRQLGIGLANLNLIFNPDAIVIGGSVYGRYLCHDKKKLEAAIAKHALDKKGPKIIDAADKTSVAEGIAKLVAESL
jgi:glucokinase